MNIFEEIEQEIELNKQQVYLKKDSIVINVKYKYEIRLSRCDTPEKLLWWISHLLEKTWMNKRVMKRFILLTCKANNITTPNHFDIAP